MKKGAVVGDEQQGARIRFQKSLKPGDGINIEVVGGFIQQQDIRSIHNGLCQQRSAFHAGGKAVKLALAVELHLVEHALYGFIAPPMFVLGNIKHASDQVVNGLGIAGGYFLYEAFDVQALGAIHHALIGSYLVGQQLEQSGFPAAIAADQPDVFSRLKIEGYLVQQHVAIPGIGYVVEVKQRHEPLFGGNCNCLKPDRRPHGFPNFRSPQLAHVPAGFGIHSALAREPFTEPGEVIFGEQEIIAREHELEIGRGG